MPEMNSDTPRYAALPYRCSSCGNPDLAGGHGDGDLLCMDCEIMREHFADLERARLQAFWTPDRHRQLQNAMAGYGSAPILPRRIFT